MSKATLTSGIFKAYDIRGVLDSTLDAAIAVASQDVQGFQQLDRLSRTYVSVCHDADGAFL